MPRLGGRSTSSYAATASVAASALAPPAFAFFAPRFPAVCFVAGAVVDLAGPEPPPAAKYFVPRRCPCVRTLPCASNFCIGRRIVPRSVLTA